MTDIQQKFNEVLAYSQGLGVDAIDTDALFEKWREAKRFFHNVFGLSSVDSEFIYKVPEEVCLKMNDKTREEYIKNFVDTLALYDTDLAYFVASNAATFYDNIVSEPFTPLDESFTVPKGMKLGKAIRKYWKPRLMENAMRNVIDSYASVLTEQELRGHLYFSIHPLDFLSISENDNDWRSCHALDGDYRSGNLSYMGDDTTFICYFLADEAQVSLPNFPANIKWNSKKWRCLLYYDETRSMIWTGRQYPCQFENAYDLIAHNLFRTPIFPKKTYEWTIRGFQDFDGKTLDYNYLTDGYTIVPVTSIIKDAPYSFHYNDLLCSHCYKPMGIKFSRPCQRIASTDKSPLIIGSTTNCIHCGKEHVFDSNTMLCESCLIELGIDHEGLYTCAHCGRPVNSNNVYWDENNDSICEDCYNDLYTTCSNCECVIKNEKAYWDENDEPVCDWCYNTREEQ